MDKITVITHLLSAFFGSLAFCIAFFCTSNGIFYLFFGKPLFHVTPKLLFFAFFSFMVSYLLTVAWKSYKSV